MNIKNDSRRPLVLDHDVPSFDMNEFRPANQHHKTRSPLCYCHTSLPGSRDTDIVSVPWSAALATCSVGHTCRRLCDARGPHQRLHHIDLSQISSILAPIPWQSRVRSVPEALRYSRGLLRILQTNVHVPPHQGVNGTAKMQYS